MFYNSGFSILLGAESGIMCSQEMVLENPICYEMELSLLDQEPGVSFSAPLQSAQDTQPERPLLCEIVASHLTMAVGALVLVLLRNRTNRRSWVTMRSELGARAG